MTSSSDEILKHKTIYFPWTDGLGYPNDPVEFTLALAQQLRLSITVVCSSKSNIPDELQRADYITERSNKVSGRPSVALLFYPSRKLLDKVPTRSAEYIVAAEYPTVPLTTWAAKRDAWNIRTSQTMTLDLTPEIKKIYDRILWNGNNSWRDAPGKRDTLRDLKHLQNQGALDKEQLLGYLTGPKRSGALEQLEKLIDRVAAEEVG